jgi:glycyl-radical enzyme activating protein
MGEASGVVFNIQKFSLHDGDGIRTVVFLKGCPLACRWCANPEGRSFRSDLLFGRDRCIGPDGCRRCLAACPPGALRAVSDGRVDLDRTRCDSCGACVRVCPAGAFEKAGRRMTVAEVLHTVEEDSAFYARSGGGLTLSGGEPLSQPRFALALLAAAHGRGLDTAVETSGMCRWADLAAVAPFVDRLFFDIKCVDDGTHRAWTDVPNRRILANFSRLRAEFPDLPVVVRTPVVPDFNDGGSALEAIAGFVASAGGAAAWERLPYHRLGEPKYARLGLTYPMAALETGG